MPQAELFGAPDLPNGLAYQPEFLSASEERDLLAHIARLPFREATWREYTARRRVVRFGAADYLDEEENDFPRVEFPAFLYEVRERVAAWIGVAPASIVHGLVTEYRPGTPIGWHRDAPHFEEVAGISLGGEARMRFRPLGRPSRPNDIVELLLQPRSAYRMRGDIRWKWAHSIAPVRATRYSITMRTLATARPPR